MATTPKTEGSYAQKGAMIQARDQHLEVKALKMPQHIQISSDSATLQCVLECQRLWSGNKADTRGGAFSWALLSCPPVPVPHCPFAMSSVGLPPNLPSTRRPSMTVTILPPLPAIQSERIQRQIFTHPSLIGGHRDDFQAPQSDPSPDNEELAHIGDQVFSLAVTDLIQALYPHLRVGPSSKVRDYVKRRDVLAEVSVQYGLHERLGLPELQARHLKTSQNVQAHVFKAFVGGLYRDRGFEVVREWLTPYFRSRLEDAYKAMREAYLVEPATEVSRQTAESTASYPSLPSPPLSQNAECALPSSPGDNPGQPSRRVQPQANRSQQESGHARGGIDARSETTYQPGGRHRRRPAGRRGDANGTQSRRRTATGSDTTGRTRTWARSGHVDNA